MHFSNITPDIKEAKVNPTIGKRLLLLLEYSHSHDGTE